MCCVCIKQMLIKMSYKTEENCDILPAIHTQTSSHIATGKHFSVILHRQFLEQFLESWLVGHRAREEERETDASLPESWQLQTSFILSLWPAMLRVSLFITSHRLGRFQSTALTHTHTEQEEQKVKGSGRKLKEHWKGSVKTLRDRWGSWKRTNKLDLEKGKGHEKDTEDAKNDIHSTLTSHWYICQFKNMHVRELEIQRT